MGGVLLPDLEPETIQRYRDSFYAPTPSRPAGDDPQQDDGDPADGR